MRGEGIAEDSEIESRVLLSHSSYLSPPPTRIKLYLSAVQPPETHWFERDDALFITYFPLFTPCYLLLSPLITRHHSTSHITTHLCIGLISATAMALRFNRTLLIESENSFGELFRPYHPNTPYYIGTLTFSCSSWPSMLSQFPPYELLLERIIRQASSANLCPLSSCSFVIA